MNDEPLWYKNAVFYELYVRAFYDSNGDGHGDLEGVIQKLDYLEELGIDCIWLMPIFPSPLLDDGYDIADYYGILSEYGSIDDFKRLIQAVHARGMRVITDLVLNHTSDQHPWFQSARSAPNSPYHDYYVWSDTDQKYRDARIIFLDTEPSNWTLDPVAGKYYWHRFYASQPDLNYANLRVQEEMLQIMKFWLDLGVDGFRADAVPYLFEREGTNCENLPETHQYLKRIRQVIDERYPGQILLAEANQWPEDVRAYFGEGDEFQMGFHFPVMPRLYMALRKADRTPIQWILDRTPSIPESCQWCTFLRNHDELTLEMVTPEEREWMWQEYAPDARMRLNLGIRRRLAPLLDNDCRKLALMNALLFSLPGTPIVYYGDEIGMGDNIWLDDRNGVRTPLQWTAGPTAGFSTASPDDLYSPLLTGEYKPEKVNVAIQRADPASLYHLIRHMIAVRKAHPVFGQGNFNWVEVDDRGVAAYLRTLGSNLVLALNNLTGEKKELALEISAWPTTRAENILNGERFDLPASGKIIWRLDPYGYAWLKPV